MPPLRPLFYFAHYLTSLVHLLPRRALVFAYPIDCALLSPAISPATSLLSHIPTRGDTKNEPLLSADNVESVPTMSRDGIDDSASRSAGCDKTTEVPSPSVEGVEHFGQPLLLSWLSPVPRRVDLLPLAAASSQTVGVDIQLTDWSTHYGMKRIYVGLEWPGVGGRFLLKLAAPGYTTDQLRVEFDVLDMLADLPAGVPKTYGLFKWSGARDDRLVLAISFCGRPVRSWRDLSLRQRAELYAILETIHFRGVAHGDVEPRNVVLDDDGCITLIDFDCASRHHACPGGLDCSELNRLAEAFASEPAAPTVSRCSLEENVALSPS